MNEEYRFHKPLLPKEMPSESLSVKEIIESYEPSSKRSVFIYLDDILEPCNIVLW